MVGYIFGGDTGVEDAATLARKRQMVDQLRQQSISGAPRNLGEGLTSIGQALAARMSDKSISGREQAERDRLSGIFSQLTSGGMQPPMGASVPSVSTQPLPDSPAAVGSDAMTAIGRTPNNMAPFRDAIASIESAGSGDYAAVGPTHPRLGRALGRYQVMEANIGPWSREVLGREVTPDEFMANPQIQDAIFDGKFGGYVNQYGSEGAAQAWFGGPGGVGQVSRRDSLGTSIGDYTQKFTAAMGGGGQGPQMGNAGGQFDPAMIAQLSELAGNPYASESQRAIANALMQQQMQSLDPMRQLQMTQMQMQIDQMGQSQPGYRQVTGAELGMQGDQAGALFNVGPDGEVSQIGGAGTSVNVSTGNVPPGYQQITDPETGAIRMEPIPGGPVEREIEEAEKAALIAQENLRRTGGAAIQDVGRALELLGVDRTVPIAGGISGLRATIGPLVGDYDARNLRQFVESAKSSVSINEIMKMREAGGTLGAIPYQQQQSFERMLGELDPDGDPVILEQNFKRLHNLFWAMVDPQGSVRPEPFALPFDESGFTSQPSIAPPPQQAAPRATNPDTGQVVEWNGQEWVPVNE